MLEVELVVAETNVGPLSRLSVLLFASVSVSSRVMSDKFKADLYLSKENGALAISVLSSHCLFLYTHKQAKT